MSWTTKPDYVPAPPVHLNPWYYDKVTARKMRQAMYDASENGRATHRRYDTSTKGRERHRNHDKRRGQATRIRVAGKHLRLPSMEMKREVAELKAQRRACR